MTWSEFVRCSGNRALARILEHREHDARDPNAESVGDNDIVFRDDDGSRFSVAAGETVSREAALKALRMWIMDQRFADIFLWS